MSHSLFPEVNEERPEFMVTLGLAPPYVIEDVHQAYRERAKTAHPDRGGSLVEFNDLHQAYERAQAYLKFREDRRGWIASHMDRYVALERAIERLQRLGAKVTTKAPEWLEHSFGDFSQLTETVVLVRAADAANGDELIAAMVEEYEPLRELREVEMPGARVSDDAVLSLSVFSMIARLDFSRTPITDGALAVVESLEALESFDIEETAIGWWARHRLQAKLRRRSAG